MKKFSATFALLATSLLAISSQFAHAQNSASTPPLTTNSNSAAAPAPILNSHTDFHLSITATSSPQTPADIKARRLRQSDFSRIQRITSIDAGDRTEQLEIGAEVKLGSLLSKKGGAFKVTANGDFIEDEITDDIGIRRNGVAAANVRDQEAFGENPRFGWWQIIRNLKANTVEVRESISTDSGNHWQPAHHITVNPNDPQPQSISTTNDGRTVYLLEENDKQQRLRRVVFEDGKDAPISDKILLTVNLDPSSHASPPPLDVSRIEHIEAIACDYNGTLLLSIQRVGQPSTSDFKYAANGELIPIPERTVGALQAELKGHALQSLEHELWRRFDFDDETLNMVKVNNGVWQIIHNPRTHTAAIRELTKKEKWTVYRRMEIPNDHKRRYIAASPDGNTVYLLENYDKQQRVRRVKFENGKDAPISDKILLTVNLDPSAHASPTLPPTPESSASPASLPLATTTNAATPAVSPTPLTALPEPTPPPPNQTKILFLPPPMDGDISLGIFDANGHLVRTLKREADLNEFGKAFDGLIAVWDGKDDAGNLAPAGKYEARGFTIGDMDFEGVDTFGNDWFTDDDSPRIRRITRITTNQKSEPFVSSQLADGKMFNFNTDSKGDISTNTPNPGVMVLDYATTRDKAKAIVDVFPTAVGYWKIIRNEKGTLEVEDEVQSKLPRRLTINPNDPQPVKIAASQDGNTIYLLEENASEQRLRCLTLESENAAPSPSPTANATPLITSSASAPTATATPQSSPLAEKANATENSLAKNDVKISKWRVVFSKTITFSDDFDAVKNLLQFENGKPFTPVAQITVKLTPNPLLEGKTESVAITAAFDAAGSFLKTTDGLELARISDTPNLKWVRIGRETGSRAITIFQSDGAVIEEYKLDKLAKMMSFDAGDFQFKPKSADLPPKPAPSASPSR